MIDTRKFTINQKLKNMKTQVYVVNFEIAGSATARNAGPFTSRDNAEQFAIALAQTQQVSFLRIAQVDKD